MWDFFFFFFFFWGGGGGGGVMSRYNVDLKGIVSSDSHRRDYG